MTDAFRDTTESLEGTGNLAAPPRWLLRVVDGPDHGVEFALDQGLFRLGTATPSELRLTDPAVSRIHLVLEVLERSVRVSDAQSTNGSYFEGRKFEVLEAKLGTVLRVGRTHLKFTGPAELDDRLAPSASQVFGGLVGKSLVMRQVFARLERAAGSDGTLLLQGETGTGKELAAHAVHMAGPRASGPFVVCDLASVSAGLIESELFGHVRGAFTGAHSDRVGAVARAEGGSLFLDEVGELSLEAQARLLRALEQRTIRAVGGGEERTVDLRVMAATHRNLEVQVRAGAFRADLMHRLTVLSVELPPLRARSEDISSLADIFLERLGHPPSALSPTTRALLREHTWPGNVRELRNVVERVVSLGVEEGLPATLHPASAPNAEPEGTGFKQAKEDMIVAFERDYVMDLMRRFEGNVSRAARAAGIDRVYLHRLLRKHKLAAKLPRG